MSGPGQNVKYSPGVHVFRVSPDNGHAAAQQKLTLCATPGKSGAVEKRASCLMNRLPFVAPWQHIRNKYNLEVC
jgi:hypothetical protein